MAFFVTKMVSPFLLARLQCQESLFLWHRNNHSVTCPLDVCDPISLISVASLAQVALPKLWWPQSESAVGDSTGMRRQHAAGQWQPERLDTMTRRQLEEAEAKWTKGLERVLQEQSKADDKEVDQERFKRQHRKFQRELNLVMKEKRKRGLLPPLVPAIGGESETGQDAEQEEKKRVYRFLAAQRWDKADLATELAIGGTEEKKALEEPAAGSNTAAKATEGELENDDSEGSDECWGCWQPEARPAAGGRGKTAAKTKDEPENDDSEGSDECWGRWQPESLPAAGGRGNTAAKATKDEPEDDDSEGSDEWWGRWQPEARPAVGGRGDAAAKATKDEPVNDEGHEMATGDKTNAKQGALETPPKASPEKRPPEYLKDQLPAIGGFPFPGASSSQPPATGGNLVRKRPIGVSDTTWVRVLAQRVWHGVSDVGAHAAPHGE